LSEPVQVPKGTSVVNLKFIFVKKVGENGLVDRYKARLVYNHLKEGETDENNYAPVASRVSLKVFLAAAAAQRWELVQADVKTAFLNADNPGREYVRLPKEVVKNEAERVRILQKALYGLQRAPKMWHLTFANWAVQVGFQQSEHDACMFLHSEKKQMIIIYVDDMLLAADGKESMKDLCGILTSKFQSRLLGTPSYFLGMNLVYNKHQGLVMLTQQTYIDAVVEKYGLDTLLPRSLPLKPGLKLQKQGEEEKGKEIFPEYGSLIGALLFLAVCTRPDVSFAVGMLSKFVSAPTRTHWETAINVVGYLKGTRDTGICLGKTTGREVVGYADSDWGNDIDDRMSISGGIIYWGTNVVSWFSRKQTMVSLSTAEAESHAMVDVSKEIIYVQRIVGEVMKFFGREDLLIPLIYSDNQPAIDAVLNGKGRTKHYDLRLKYLAFGISNNLFEIEKVATIEIVADVFTKVLRATRFKMLASAIVTSGQFPRMCKLRGGVENVI
jgi:hypothetical protein